MYIMIFLYVYAHVPGLYSVITVSIYTEQYFTRSLYKVGAIWKFTSSSHVYTVHVLVINK